MYCLDCMFSLSFSPYKQFQIVYCVLRGLNSLPLMHQCSNCYKSFDKKQINEIKFVLICQIKSTMYELEPPSHKSVLKLPIMHNCMKKLLQKIWIRKLSSTQLIDHFIFEQCECVNV
jgi:hypothetical protein